jgi:hypothetical protein
MWTAIRGHLECLKWLIEEVKVEFNICDSEGLTPLDNAVIQARYECALYLKKKGQVLKSTDFYRTKNDKFLFDQVNIDGFIDGLTQEDDVILEDMFEEKSEGNSCSNLKTRGANSTTR